MMKKMMNWEMVLLTCHTPMVDTPDLSLVGQSVFYADLHLSYSDACGLLLQSELYSYDQCSFILFSRCLREMN